MDYCILYHLDFNQMLGEKDDGNYTRMLHAVFNKYGSSTLHNSRCIVTFLQSPKPPKQDILGMAREVWTNS